MNSLLPAWFKQEIPDAQTFGMAHLCLELGVHTVCAQAACPNITSCYKNRKATFLILGDTCTRDCGFCAVKKSGVAAALSLDRDEPWRIREAIKKLGIKYAVITSVTRDDLADGGAQIFSRTIKALRSLNTDIRVEVLIPDFRLNISSLKCVVEAGPDVIAHNLETVQRLYRPLRPSSSYEVSLRVLREIKVLKPALITKSSLMLGLGETEEEVFGALRDLRDCSCDILTLGQYLAPSQEHYPVKEFISTQQFGKYREMALALGFQSVFSGPLVRSSYQAERVYNELIHA